MADKGQIIVICGSNQQNDGPKIARAFLSSGYGVVMTYTIDECLKKLYEVPVDLVIMFRDNSWTETDDSLFAFRVKTDAAILVLGERQYMPETLESGADAYMYPPMPPDELVAKAGSVIRRCKGTTWGGAPRSKNEDYQTTIFLN